jgi:hypothetical protein
VELLAVSAADFTDGELAAAMRRMKGEPCTLSADRHVMRALKERRLMKFNEWPSGHWAITERGHRFLNGLGQ